jgi:hypothetical protein
MGHLLDLAKVAVRNALGMAYHGSMLNERYLHHSISYQLQAASPLLDVHGETASLVLHPEWPTSKRSTGLSFGTYRMRNGRYMPTDEGSSGFVDFALGAYARPEVGIELTLKSNGWSHEEVVYDLVKLLDERNPFEGVISFNVVLRPNGVSKGQRKQALQRRMREAYKDAQSRLSECVQARERKSLIIVSEIAQSARRHWFYDSQMDAFVESADVPSILQ